MSTIAKKNTYKEPWYVRNNDPDYVAYGIEAETWSSTDHASKFQLVRTKGKSQILSLDNKPNNFVSGKDYFIFSGRDIGDVGSVAFIELKRTATVTRYTDFAEMRRIRPSISVQYFLTPRYYQTECSTGRLRLINAYHKKAGAEASFSFGAYLDHPSESRYLKAAKAVCGGGFNASAPRGENCSS